MQPTRSSLDSPNYVGWEGFYSLEALAKFQIIWGETLQCPDQYDRFSICFNAFVAVKTPKYLHKKHVEVKICKQTGLDFGNIEIDLTGGSSSDQFFYRFNPNASHYTVDDGSGALVIVDVLRKAIVLPLRPMD
jgi:hypothetical protein